MNPFGCKVNFNSKILVIGQTPGQKVQNSGVPWDDVSGNNLRQWFNVSSEQFYDTNLFAIMPMGFAFQKLEKTQN